MTKTHRAGRYNPAEEDKLIYKYSCETCGAAVEFCLPDVYAHFFGVEFSLCRKCTNDQEIESHSRSLATMLELHHVELPALQGDDAAQVARAERLRALYLSRNEYDLQCYLDAPDCFSTLELFATIRLMLESASAAEIVSAIGDRDDYE